MRQGTPKLRQPGLKRKRPATPRKSVKKVGKKPRY
jgi:hypothetical protein